MEQLLTINRLVNCSFLRPESEHWSRQ